MNNSRSHLQAMGQPTNRLQQAEAQIVSLTKDLSRIQEAAGLHGTISVDRIIGCINALKQSAQQGHSKAAARREPQWTPITQPGQVKVGTKLRFTFGGTKYTGTAKLILHAGTDKEEIIYNKRQNFYLITSMAIQNTGSQKNVEYLAAVAVPAACSTAAHEDMGLNL